MIVPVLVVRTLAHCAVSINDINKSIKAKAILFSMNVKEQDYKTSTNNKSQTTVSTETCMLKKLYRIFVT
jgi:hypothetical protein